MRGTGLLYSSLCPEIEHPKRYNKSDFQWKMKKKSWVLQSSPCQLSSNPLSYGGTISFVLLFWLMYLYEVLFTFHIPCQIWLWLDLSLGFLNLIAALPTHIPIIFQECVSLLLVTILFHPVFQLNQKIFIHLCWSPIVLVWFLAKFLCSKKNVFKYLTDPSCTFIPEGGFAEYLSHPPVP